MRKDEKQALAETWHQRIQLWQSSGQTGADWCKEQNFIYHQFVYWKGRLKQKNKRDKIPLPAKFVEVVDTPELFESGVSVNYRGARIHLARNFDDTVFLRCLRIMKDL